MVWISLIDAVDWKSIGIKFHRSTGRRSERGFVWSFIWLTIRAQYANTIFAEYTESAFPSFNDCRADGVTSSRGSLGSQHSVGSSSSSIGHACWSRICICLHMPLCLFCVLVSRFYFALGHLWFPYPFGSSCFLFTLC